jgi:hypothetical protein
MVAAARNRFGLPDDTEAHRREVRKFLIGQIKEYNERGCGGDLRHTDAHLVLETAISLTFVPSDL